MCGHPVRGYGGVFETDRQGAEVGAGGIKGADVVRYGGCRPHARPPCVPVSDVFCPHPDNCKRM